MLIFNYRSKKELVKSIGNYLDYTETSMFGLEYEGIPVAGVMHFPRLAETVWATDAGAVNVVQNDGGSLVGHNTDGVGFIRALEEEGGFSPEGRRVLIIGAGGSARAVALALARSDAASDWISEYVSRNNFNWSRRSSPGSASDSNSLTNPRSLRCRSSVIAAVANRCCARALPRAACVSVRFCSST